MNPLRSRGQILRRSHLVKLSIDIPANRVLGPFHGKDVEIVGNNPLIGNTLAIIVPILVAGLFGLFNGVLVTTFRIQPIIATLVLFIAGRGIAQVMTNGFLQVFKNFFSLHDPE